MEDDFLIITIEYRFSSGLGSLEIVDCITAHTAVIHAEDYSEKSAHEYVGEIEFKVIYLGKAEEEGVDIFELFDTYEYTFRHAQNFYDFKMGTLKQPLLNEFPDIEIWCNRICIIEKIGIVPKYRGRGIGAKFFKNLVLHFGYCGLFILQPYPLQFDAPDRNGALWSKLDLEKFEKNEEKSKASLSKYYQSWGFKEAIGIPDLLFYSPIYRSEAFDNIEDF